MSKLTQTLPRVVASPSRRRLKLGTKTRNSAAGTTTTQVSQREETFWQQHETRRHALLKAEQPRLLRRARSEADMIAQALSDAPPLDRDAMGADAYPFNSIASCEPVISVVEKIVRRREGNMAWLPVHRALQALGDWDGYCLMIDTIRDVSFMVGVDYAQRDLPDWWSDYERLDPAAKSQLAETVRITIAFLNAGGAK